MVAYGFGYGWLMVLVMGGFGFGGAWSDSDTVQRSSAMKRFDLFCFVLISEFSGFRFT